MNNGIDKQNRTGIDTRSVFGYQMRFDLAVGFPAVTVKKLLWEMVTSELLWFLEGNVDERRLAEIRYQDDRSNLIGKRTIWTDNADHQGVALGYENTDTIKELGPIYGYQWRNYDFVYYKNSSEVLKSGRANGVDQISNAINEIKTNPDSRRIIVSAWNPLQIKNMALPPCHCFFQFYVVNGKLSCQMYQRSVDVGLGLPANIASYSLLTHMIAKECDLEVGEFVHTSGDLHVYHNHFDAIDTMTNREPLPLPELWLNPEVKSVFNYTMDDIKLIGYNHHPNVKMQMAV